MFSIPGFALMRALGQQRGVTDTDALNRISLIGGAVGFSPIGIVVGDSLIRRELDSTPPPPETPLAETALVPPVVGVHAEAATNLLTEAGFRTITFVPDSTSPAEEDTVINQDPDPGQTVPTSTTITLTVSTGEQEPAGNAGHEKTALIAAQVSAVSDEVVRRVPDVTPHVAAAVAAIRQAVDQVQGQANQPPGQPPPEQAEKAVAAKPVPDGAATTTAKQTKKSE